MSNAFRPFLALLSVMLIAAPAWAQQGALTVPQNLQQLTGRAALIVRGNVVSARMEHHAELRTPVLVVTLRVRETMKGAHAESLTFRQYLWDVRDRADHAGYRKGDDLLLMLIAPSRYGLSSPAGMEQGRFRIVRDENGRELVVNGYGNARLMDGLDAQLIRDGIRVSEASRRLVRRQRAGGIDAAEFTGLVRDLVHARR